MSRANKQFVGQAEVNNRLGEVLFIDRPKSPALNPEQYEFEKIIGRRLPSGRQPLKRLQAGHRNVIALYLRGLSLADISTVTGYSEANVGFIIKDPLSQEYIKAHIEAVDAEVEALASQAVDAVRTGLVDEDPKVRLQAADRFFKVTGRFAKAEDRKETAEDVLARALARVAQDQSSALRELSRPNPTHQLAGLHEPKLIEGRVSDEEREEEK